MKLGLALGAGAAKGWAHIGILKGLEEAGLEIAWIAGTSIGSLVGAVYAAGNLDAFAQDIIAMDWKRVVAMIDLVLPRNGVIDGQKVMKLLQQYLPQTIEALNIPYAAVATDIYTGKEVVLKSGSVLEAVRASIAVPTIFTPVITEKYCLVDGGLVNPVPVDVVRSLGAEKVLAVDLIYESPASFIKNKEQTSKNKDNDWLNKIAIKIKEKFPKVDLSFIESFKNWIAKGEDTPHLFEIMHSSLSIMEQRLTQILFELYPPDFILRPPLDHIKLRDFHRGKECIEIGYKEIKKILPSILAS
ncbi:MAG: patatin-like phospholipase family protein [Desulfonauticus sp.]|nr:patatin-like phospholipase family protein [Desulfonauticus sp.]